MNFKRFFIADSQCSVKATLKARVVSINIAFAVAFTLEDFTDRINGADRPGYANPVFEVESQNDADSGEHKQHEIA